MVPRRNWRRSSMKQLRGAPRMLIRCNRFARSEKSLALTGVFMQGIWRRLILMALLILVGWRNESLAQTTATAPPQKPDEQEQRLRIVTNEVRYRYGLSIRWADGWRI